MKISRGSVRVFVVMTAALFLLMVGPAAVMAGGEPGGGCGLEGFKYDPAPYIGDITLTWDKGNVEASGVVEQSGNSFCTGLVSGVVISGVDRGVFQSWKASDLRLTCITNVCAIGSDYIEDCPFNCLEDGAKLEVIGVGGMTWLTENSFSAKFVIMHLQ